MLGVLFLSTALLSDAPTWQLSTLDGRRLEGSLVEWKPDQLTLATSEGRPSVALRSVLDIKRVGSVATTEKPSVWVTLVDGSTLLATAYTVRSGQASLTLTGDVKVTVATRFIEHIRLREHSGVWAQQWNDILKAERTGDVIVVRKEDTLDFVSGAAGDIDDETVQFQIDGEKIPVKRPKVEGVLYFRAARPELPASICRAQLDGGSVIAIATVTVTNGVLSLRTPSGIELTGPAAYVSRFQFNVTYLSDLPSEKETVHPFLTSTDDRTRAAYARFFQPQRNRALDRGPLKLSNRTYDKGLALPGPSEVVFRLGEEYAALQGVVGIDDSARPLGDVRLLILGDDQPLLDTVLTGRMPPLDVNVKLKGVRRLKIVVNCHGDEVGDRVNFCDIRLVQ